MSTARASTGSRDMERANARAPSFATVVDHKDT
jgi:hypothetical protein